MPTPTDPAGLLQSYLSAMTDAGASDLFLESDRSPSLRTGGSIVPLTTHPAPTPQQMQQLLALLLTPVSAQHFDRSPDIDVGYTTPAGARFRISLFMQQGALALVARHIRSAAELRPDALGLPPVVLQLADARRGLILVVGPAGSGKSTTLAALIHHINHTRPDHIITIEDPVEFLHEPARSLVHQRQVGHDTASFATALRHVIRQAPDVVLVGEMRDHETMETALSAALTGHLVLSSLHTSGVVQSIDRLVNYFPGDQRKQVQLDIAQTLVGMVAMRLVPRADGKGRVAAVEVLLGTPLVRRTLAEGRVAEVPDMMKRGKDAGMITLNASLAELVQTGQITETEALLQSPNPDELRLLTQGMYTGVESIHRTR